MLPTTVFGVIKNIVVVVLHPLHHIYAHPRMYFLETLYSTVGVKRLESQSRLKS